MRAYLYCIASGNFQLKFDYQWAAVDEPTSGLDSSIALEVMGVVRKLADQNRTCVATIHQPSPEVFGLFDKVVLVSAGRLIYFGAAADVIPYFTQPALGYKYNGSQNPAEFMIDVSNGQIFPNDLKICRLPEELEILYKKTKYYIPPANTGGYGTQITADLNSPFTSAYATNLFTHFKMLLTRSWISTVRDTNDMKAQIGKNVVGIPSFLPSFSYFYCDAHIIVFFPHSVGILVSIIFSGQAATTTPFYTNGVPNSEVANISSLLFFSMTFCLVANMQAIPYLCLRAQIYRRELAAFAYAPAPYWLVSTVVNLPILLFNHLIFVVICYFSCSFPNDASYFFYFAFLLYFANVLQYLFAMFLAVSTGSQALAFSIFPVTFLFVTTFSGYAIVVEDIPNMWIFGPYISYGRFADSVFRLDCVCYFLCIC